MQTRGCTLLAFVMQPRCDRRRSFEFSRILEIERIDRKTFFVIFSVIPLFDCVRDTLFTRCAARYNNGLRGGTHSVVETSGYRREQLPTAIRAAGN